MAYATWEDLVGVEGLLDERAFPNPPRGLLTMAIEDAGMALDKRLSRRFSVPFDEELEPQAYQMVHMIVVKQAGASFIRQQGQAAGREDWLWIARQWDKDAADLIALFETERPPEDATPSDNPVQNLPSAGRGVEVAGSLAARVAAPIFARKHVIPGHPEHH
jgi:hypothetical protein